MVQPIAFITSPLGGSGEAGPPELPDGNRAGRARKTSGVNPMRGPISSREWVGAGGSMSYGERGGAGEPRRGQSREGPAAGLSHLNPSGAPAPPRPAERSRRKRKGRAAAGAASAAAGAAVGTGGECGSAVGPPYRPSAAPRAGRARPAPPR